MKPLDKENSLEMRYQTAITTLLDLALDHSHNRAKVAASVLLSANRSYVRPQQRWRVSIPDLQQLTDCEQYAALGVIHGRITLGRSPETVTQGGPELFHKLWHRWRNVERW
jgi:hypothetical protein